MNFNILCLFYHCFHLAYLDFLWEGTAIWFTVTLLVFLPSGYYFIVEVADYFFQVEVGQQLVVPAYSKVSLLPQPSMQDSDEELEYADVNSGIIDSPCKFFMLLITQFIFNVCIDDF